MFKSSLKKITLNQASKYFSQQEDLIDSPIRFYTLTEDEDRWDKITYYTSRRKDIYANRGEADQWVYILSNPALPNMLKIGYTKNEPEVRAKQISDTKEVKVNCIFCDKLLLLKFKPESGF